MGLMSKFAGAVPPNVPPRARSAAQWFFIIAALSFVNSAMMLSGGDVVMVVGLGITLVASVLLRGVGPMAALIVMLITLAIAALFVMIGLWARQGRRWAFVLGMALYAVDAVWFVLFKDWFALAFHAVALISMFAGYQSLRGWSPATVASEQPAPGQVVDAPPTYGVEASEGREAESA